MAKQASETCAPTVTAALSLKCLLQLLLYTYSFPNWLRGQTETQEGVKSVTCSHWSQDYLYLSVVRSLDWLSNAFISGIKKRKQFWGKNNAKIKHLEHLQKSYKCLKHYLKICVLLRCLLLLQEEDTLCFLWSDGQLDSQEDCWQAQCSGCTQLLGEIQV